MQAHVILIVDDEPAVAGALSDALEAEGRRMIVCADEAAASVIMGRTPVSMVLTDLRLSPPFGFEGLSLIKRVVEAKQETVVVAMTGFADETLEATARAHGAGLVLAKPFGAERVEHLLAFSRPVELPSWLEADTGPIWFPSLDDELFARDLHAVFQPIVDVQSGDVFGVEALARSRGRKPFHDIGTLVEYASRRDRIADLDLMLIANSIEGGGCWAKSSPLFVNVHPWTLVGPDRLVPRLLVTAAQHGVAPENLVIEITEHAALPNQAGALACIDELRAAGVRFALDDVGVAYSHLALIDRIQPSFLKISQDFGTDFERHSVKGRLVRNIARLAADFGVDVILEGVETEATMVAAREHGIRYAQGYHLGRPGAIDAIMERGIAA
jgi:EAL domain-containing protein (putative c-di-GMP-specific phosphodiesterase class I)/ActR/RegA family two-component response regulator